MPPVISPYMFTLKSPFEDSPAALSSELSQAPVVPIKPVAIAGTEVKPDTSIDIPEGSQKPHEKFVNMPDLVRAILTGAGAALTGGLSVAAGAGIAGLNFASEKSRDEQVDEQLGQTVRLNAANTDIEIQGKLKLQKLGIADAKVSMGATTIYQMGIDAAKAGKDSFEAWKSSLPETPEFNMFKQGFTYEAAIQGSLGSTGTKNSLQLMKLCLDNGLPGWSAFMEGFKNAIPGLSENKYKEIEFAAQKIPGDVMQKLIEHKVSIKAIHQFMTLNAARRMTDPAGADAEFESIRSLPANEDLETFVLKLKAATSLGLDNNTLTTQTEGIVTGDQIDEAANAAHKRAQAHARVQDITNMTAAQRMNIEDEYFSKAMTQWFDSVGGYDVAAIQSMIDTFGITEEKLMADPSLLEVIKGKIISYGQLQGLHSDVVLNAIGTPEDLLADVLKQVKEVAKMRTVVVKPKAR